METRILAGDLCLVLTGIFPLYLTAVMLRRRERVVARKVDLAVYRYEMLICAVFLLLSGELRFDLTGRLPGGAIRSLAELVRWGLLAFAAGILLLAGAVVLTGLRRPGGEAGQVLVLGNTLERGKPGRDLQARLRAAADYAKTHPEAALVLSGGNEGPGSPAEAQAMALWLREAGLPEARLRLDPQSVTTEDNFRKAARLLDPAEPLILVTSDYHMCRALTLAKGCGYAKPIPYPTPSDPLRYPANVVWELVGLVHALLRGKTRRKP